MRIIEKFKLIHRANKYKRKDDKGGIAYINSTVKSGQTVFDIGAHKAGYLYFFQKLVGKDGYVYAFEPQSNLFKYITKIVSLLAWKNVTIEHLALSDAAGEVTLYIPANKVSKDSAPGATILNQGRTDLAKTETVRTESIDLYCERNNLKPDFLKIDVEGNELKVLKGAVAILKKHKPKILVEIEAQHVGQERVMETFDYLMALGYTGYILHELNHIPISEFAFTKHQNLNDKKNYCNNFIFE